MTRRRPPEFIDIPPPEKPVREMTPAERDAYVRQLRRAVRDYDVRRGARRPQTMRETRRSCWQASPTASTG